MNFKFSVTMNTQYFQTGWSLKVKITFLFSYALEFPLLFFNVIINSLFLNNWTQAPIIWFHTFYSAQIHFIISQKHWLNYKKTEELRKMEKFDSIKWLNCVYYLFYVNNKWLDAF